MRLVDRLEFRVVSVWLVASTALCLGACQGADRSSSGGGDADTDADTDTDSDSDIDTDVDTDVDADTDTDVVVELSYIWIANTGAGTLSKVDTVEAVEVGRYYTGPGGSGNDPSRTSVNRHGDMVVTNRNPWSGPSSVTKFLANVEECYDKNDNEVIDTSTGPSEVLAWEEDECMMWHTSLGGSSGARATAWDGEEDPETGLGGHVWIGSCSFGDTNYVYKLDGDWGDIEEQVSLPVGCAYGGAVDGNGGFWIMDNNSWPANVVRVDMDTLDTEAHQVDCGYGISVDSQGRVWTGGSGSMAGSCVNRYDPATDQNLAVTLPEATFPRGIAVGTAMSEGSVWSADTGGNLYEIDEETVQVLDWWLVGAFDMIGVAIDYEGHVWTVSQTGNAAYKFNPETDSYDTVMIGSSPYTYSDMTGVQLSNVHPVE